jgi:hypothetical protein
MTHVLPSLHSFHQRYVLNIYISVMNNLHIYTSELILILIRSSVATVDSTSFFHACDPALYVARCL